MISKKSDLEFLPLDFEPLADEVDIDSEIEHKFYVDKLLSVLNDRECKILILRFYYEKTRKYIASLFNVSETRISQIEFKAMRKMKSSTSRSTMSKIRRAL